MALSISPIGLGLLVAIGASAAFVHFRGRVRHRFSRQLFDHSTLFAPFNIPLYLFSKVPGRPFHDPRAFPELDLLRDNWRVIREEGLTLVDGGDVGAATARAAADYNDAGFNSFFRTGWERFYLKWYDEPLPSAAALCPKTVALLAQVPTVHGAMFALLPPGGRLGGHRDPFAGSLRYHLGLRTADSPDCYILVDGERYYWRDGEDVVFDETFIHTAENKTDVKRLILFCDVERPVYTPLIRAYNRLCRGVMKASATQNVPGEYVGGVNKVFAYAFRANLLTRRLKAWNRKVYYTLKYAVFAGVVLLIVL